MKLYLKVITTCEGWGGINVCLHNRELKREERKFIRSLKVQSPESLSEWPSELKKKIKKVLVKGLLKFSELQPSNNNESNPKELAFCIYVYKLFPVIFVSQKVCGQKIQER